MQSSNTDTDDESTAQEVQSITSCNESENESSSVGGWYFFCYALF